jgi:hypothetical protein
MLIYAGHAVWFFPRPQPPLLSLRKLQDREKPFSQIYSNVAMATKDQNSNTDNQSPPTTGKVKDKGITPAARDKGTGGDQMDNRGNLKGNPEGKQGEGSHPTNMGAPNPNPDHLHGHPGKGLTKQELENQKRDKKPPH